MVDFQVYERKVMFEILQVNLLMEFAAKLSSVGVAPIYFEGACSRLSTSVVKSKCVERHVIVYRG